MSLPSWRRLLAALTRKKSYDDDAPSGETKSGAEDKSPHGPKLARCLGLADLTLLGIGSTLGVGVYVLAGSVAKNQAGPAVLVSLVVAAVASLFSGFCYVEFASRISKSGSAYTYTYLSIGEFAAYTIGWNLVLEYIIGTASEAKAIANQFDSLVGNYFERRMTALLPIESAYLADYPDFIAAGITITMTGLISYGVAESTRLNSVFTFLNLGTVSAIVLCGLGRANFANWTIRRVDIPPKYKRAAGSGGFAPFGLNGIIAGAAKCFFGFVGFDCIATTGEEAKNPKRNIPLSILLSLLVVFLCFFAIALVLTLIMPYYEQDADAPFPHIFDVVGLPFMKWVVTIGSLFALLTGMFGSLFPLPRILYAMSQDGLLYPSFAYVSRLTKTPVISSLLSGLFTAVLSAIFKLDQLVDMLSIGTLLAYTIVAISVLILRYSEEENGNSKTGNIEYIAEKINGVGKNSNNYDFDKISRGKPGAQKHQYGGCDKPYINGFVNSSKTSDSEFVVQCKGRDSYHSISDNPVNPVSLNTQKTNCSDIGLTIEKSSSDCENSRGPTDEGFDIDRLAVCGSGLGKHDKLPKQGDKSRQVEIEHSIEICDKTLDNVIQINEIELNAGTSDTNQCRTSQCSAGKDSSSAKRRKSGENCKPDAGKAYTAQFLNPPLMKRCEDCHVFDSTHISMRPNYSQEELCEASRREDKSAYSDLIKSRKLSSVTPQSQRISKICISLFILLTIAVCLILNAVSNVNLDLDGPVLLPNATLARSGGRLGNYRDKDRPSGVRENGAKFERETLADFTTRHFLWMLTTMSTAFGHEARSPGELLSPVVGGVPKLFGSYRDFGDYSSSSTSIFQTLKTAIYIGVTLAYVAVFLVLSRQNQTRPDCNFKVPLVPLIPCLSIFMNVFLMINLDVSTWVRFVVWMVVGMSVYFTYGIRNSKLKTA